MEDGTTRSPAPIEKEKYFHTVNETILGLAP